MMSKDTSRPRIPLLLGAATAIAAAAAALAAVKGAWLAAALVLLSALLCALAARAHARSRDATLRELSQAKEEAARLRDRCGGEAQAAAALGRDLVESASRSVSILHRLEGLASGAADGVAVLNQSLAQAVGAQQATDSDHARVKEALVSYSREVSAESSEVKSMVESVDRLAASSRERGETVQALLGRADGAEEKLLSIKKAVDRMIETATHTESMNALIADLAERTSLLAINASIEAAHAGAAGRGFAIVAGQVKALSEESRKSSEAISQAIAETLRAIDDTSAAAEGATAYFREVATEIKGLATIFETLLAEMQALSAGSAKILGSVELVAGLNADTAEALQSSAASMDASKSSLAVVQDIGSTLQADAASMLAAFKESLAEAAKAKELGERAAIELGNGLPPDEGAATRA